MTTIEYPPISRAHAGDLKRQLAILNDRYGIYMSPANKTRRRRSPIVSNYTKHQRLKMLRLFVDQLRACGFHPQFLDSIKTCHVKAVVSAWDHQGLVTRTLQTRLGAIRMLFGWLGRAQALAENGELLPYHHRRGSSVAQYDKTWTGNELDVFKIILLVPERYRWIGFALELQWRFGLRVKESLLIQIHAADGRDRLFMGWGGKGGRERYIPIETAVQRDLVDRIKAAVPPGESLIGPLECRTLRQAGCQYKYVVGGLLGITKERVGTTSQGLRCEYLCEQYQRFTGERAPIKGGRAIDPELDRAGRMHVAKLAGHNRRGVASAYLGAVLKQSKCR